MTEDLRALREIIRRRLPDRSPRGLLRTFPVTITALIVIIGIGILTANNTPAEHEQLLEMFGFDFEKLRAGQLLHLFTGTFIQSSPGIALSMIVLVVTSMVPCELLAGSRTTVMAFFLTDWVSTLLTALTLGALSALGVAQATAVLDVADAGSSAAAHGAYAAAAMRLPGRLAWFAYGLLLGVTIAMFWYQHLSPALAHLFAVLFGGAVSWYRVRRRPRVEATAALPPQPVEPV